MLAGRRSGCLEQYWQLDAGSLKGDNNDIASGVPLEPCNTAMQESSDILMSMEPHAQ